MPEITLSDGFVGWIAFALAFSVGLILKDVLTQFIQGVMFRFSSQFSEGDHVIISGQDAVIVSIGMRYTKFGIVKPDEVYVWLFIPNDQIKYQKIERIIRKPNNGNSNGNGTDNEG